MFTIASKNYLHFALSLIKSVKAHEPDLNCYVCLCDRLDGLNTADFPFRLITIEDLKISGIDEFIFQYNILELNTAIKPFVFQWLFENAGYEKVIYFDPDIYIYDTLDEMIQLLDRHQVLLTPHLTNCLDDNRHPSELSLLQSGTYNLGYLGLRNTSESKKLLEWWQLKMLHDCIVDIPHGLFVDQKWMDMVPGMYEGVHIYRHPGWNVAYWNLNHRHVTKKKGHYLVNGVPLVFFHFSGVSLDGKIFSKHQDRYSMHNLSPTVRTLVHSYVEELRVNGGEYYSQLDYSFGKFPDLTPIPDLAREVFRESLDSLALNAAINTEQGAQEFIAFLNKPVKIMGQSSPLVTRLSYKLFEKRKDLQMAYPDVLGQHSYNFANWFVEYAEEQAGIPAIFTQPVADRISIQAQGIRKEVIHSNKIKAPKKTMYGFTRLKATIISELYRLAWRSRSIARRFVPYNLRYVLHAWLIRHAFKPQITLSPTNNHVHKKLVSVGLNVIGYLFAASGVGESSRMAIRAATSVGLPIAALDFRSGNVSQMTEKIQVPLVEQPEYGVNVFHINADQIPIVYKELGEDFFHGHYNIGYWHWELPEFPDEQRGAYEVLDEIWTPTAFCQEAIAKKSPVPVLRIPHCISLDIPQGMNRAYFNFPSDRFLFCFMFDVLSVPERKNPIAMLDAYSQAFGSCPNNVGLVLKLTNSEYRSDFMSKIRDRIHGNSSIILIDDYLQRNELNALLKVIDCYVSLHRSEGFGLPLAESMYLAKPVIATGWSGNMDFMDPWNSLLVKYKIKMLEKDYGPYKKGSTWAEPDISHAAECMVRIVRDKALYRQLALSGQKTIRERFSPEQAGAQITKRVEEIYAWQSKTDNAVEHISKDMQISIVEAGSKIVCKG